MPNEDNQATQIDLSISDNDGSCFVVIEKNVVWNKYNKGSLKVAEMEDKMVGVLIRRHTLMQWRPNEALWRDGHKDAWKGQNKWEDVAFNGKVWKRGILINQLELKWKENEACIYQLELDG